MLRNLIQYKPSRQQGKSWLNIKLIKYSALAFKQPFMYFSLNAIASRRILWKSLPHLNIKFVSETWLEIKPCHCMQHKG